MRVDVRIGDRVRYKGVQWKVTYIGRMTESGIEWLEGGEILYAQLVRLKPKIATMIVPVSVLNKDIRRSRLVTRTKPLTHAQAVRRIERQVRIEGRLL